MLAMTMTTNTSLMWLGPGRSSAATAGTPGVVVGMPVIVPVYRIFSPQNLFRYGDSNGSIGRVGNPGVMIITLRAKYGIP